MNIVARSTTGLETLSTVEESPFCQLVNRDISGAQCLDMQGEPGCFGCASTSRLCESCSLRRVDVPAVGLCGPCIISELEKEKGLPIPTAADKGSVNCQITKREIRIAMCLATQGDEGCQGCSVSSRICEKCKERPSRFPRYGLCLKCSIEDYGDGWDPASVVIEIENKPARPETWDRTVLEKIAIKVTKPQLPNNPSEVVRLVPDGGSAASVLVIGADTSKFEDHILRDPRIRHWGAKDVHEDVMVPDGTEKIISCTAEIKRVKASLLQKLVAMARADGRQIQFYEVHHQARLREVLQGELKYKPAPPREPQPEVQPAKESVAPDPAVIASVLRSLPAQPAPEVIDGSKLSLSDRMSAALKKIHEGYAELQEIASEVSDMDARLKLLAPLEQAILQVADEIDE